MPARRRPVRPVDQARQLFAEISTQPSGELSGTDITEHSTAGAKVHTPTGPSGVDAVAGHGGFNLDDDPSTPAAGAAP
jgi:hypothetical protein